MRLLNSKKLACLPSDPIYRYFIQVWYGLTHVSSLDSHRVRCMNSYNILKEFNEIVRKDFISNLDKDIERVRDECYEIFEKDLVIKKYFIEDEKRVRLLIDEFIKEKKDKDKKDKKNSNLSSYRLMNYYITNFLEKLELNYKNYILIELSDAIFVRKSEEEINKLTGTLLSYLLDEGFTLDNLYSIAENILIDNKSKKTKTFNENFAFIVDYVNREELPYKIVFRMEGFKNIGIIPETISGINFSPEFTTFSEMPAIKKLLTPAPKVLFAATEINSKDARAAGYKARKLIEDILDLIRFELEEDLIIISEQFISIYKEKIKIFKLNHNIPNPTSNLNLEEFKLFVKFVINYIHLESNPKELKEKLSSTLRFYRIGRDSNRLENKFLNWWTALEHLVRTGGGGKIYEHTEDQTTPILILNYLPKLLKSYRDSISFCEVVPTPFAIEKYSITNYSDLNLTNFFELVRDSGEVSHILGNLSGQPVLSRSFSAFSLNLTDGKTILKFIKEHEIHIQWHLNRIWRARCDLVHSAEMNISLNLLCANLEYYLKTTFTFIVNFIRNQEKSLDIVDIYDIVFYKYKKIKDGLEHNNYTYLTESFENNFLN